MSLTTPDKNESFHIMTILDEIVFMLFDLERGGFLPQQTLDGNYELTNSDISVSYIRTTTSEYIVDDNRNIISEFDIKFFKGDTLILNFSVNGELQKFACHYVESIKTLLLIAKHLLIHRAKAFGVEL